MLALCSAPLKLRASKHQERRHAHSLYTGCCLDSAGVFFALHKNYFKALSVYFKDVSKNLSVFSGVSVNNRAAT